MSNSLDPDQARRFVGPDLVPNCLQVISRHQQTTLAGKELNQKAEGDFQAFTLFSLLDL